MKGRRRDLARRARLLVGGAALGLALAAACASDPAPRPDEPPATPPSSAASTPAPAAGPSYHVVDVGPAFWAFWDATRDEPVEVQATRFEEQVVAAHPAAFGPAVLGLDPTKTDFDLHARLVQWLPTLPSRVDVMRRLSAGVATDLDDYDRTFRAVFDDMAWTGKVYFTVSLDAFDGAVRMVDGEATLMFGLDKIAALHGESASLQPLFHHELFHLYQYDCLRDVMDSDEPPRMYQALWGEGLAVHVAHTLNPEATWGQLVLTDEMVTFGEAHLGPLAKELYDVRDSGSQEVYRDFFRGSGQRADIPTRMGYFVGMKVAERMGKDRSLKELACLRDPVLKQGIEGALLELAGPG